MKTYTGQLQFALRCMGGKVSDAEIAALRFTDPDAWELACDPALQREMVESIKTMPEIHSCRTPAAWPDWLVCTFIMPDGALRAVRWPLKKFIATAHKWEGSNKTIKGEPEFVKVCCAQFEANKFGGHVLKIGVELSNGSQVGAGWPMDTILDVMEFTDDVSDEI